MKHLHLVLLMFSLFFVACDNSVQYDVYVKNQTSAQLTVEFKTVGVSDASDKQRIELSPGASQRIISSPNIPLTQTGGRGTKSEDCSFVAEYIIAFDPHGSKSHLAWCDRDVSFSKTDIGQAEFTLTFMEEHFHR